MQTYERKDLGTPDEVRNFDKGHVDLVNIGSGVVGRLVLEPGWRWSESVKPLVHTEWCEAPHFQYHASGRLRIISNTGEEFEVGPGEITSLPAGHDAIVIGDEPVVLIDFYGASHYAESR